MKAFEHAQTLGEPDLLLAIHAADAAGRIIREGYDASLTIVEKGIGDLLSEVDREADRAVTELLRAERPDDDILSEELNPDTKERDGKRLWIIDPLDGTSAFLLRCGRQLPSVMIALRENAHDTLAVVHFPLTGEWFYAIRGKGAYKDGVRLATARLGTSLHAAWIDMNHQADAARESKAFRTLHERLRSARGARLVTTTGPQSGLALRILDQTIRLDAIIHDNAQTGKTPKQAPWDVIPIRIIMEEAGGCIVNLHGETYDPFTPEPFLVAGRPEIAAQIIGLLNA